MSQNLYRRCGCRDENGRQFGSPCPKLSSDPKHGTWGYYLSHGSDPKTGQRQQFRKTGFATKREAASAVAELKTRLDKGTYVRPTARTLGEYALEWLPRRQRSGKGLRSTTVAGYEYYLREDIAPSALGRMKLIDVRRYHVQEFLDAATAAGRGTVTVRRLATLLGTIFATAVKDELISANPARGVDRPKLDREQLDPWEPDQVRLFLDCCAQHRLGALFEVAVLTGLRRGEITGLRWSDVDLAARRVVVRRNRVTVNGRIEEQNAPKTKAGLRTVALSDFAVATLLAWQLRQAQEAEAGAEAWHTEGHVFTMEDATHSTPPRRPGCSRRSARGLVSHCHRSVSTA